MRCRPVNSSEKITLKIKPKIYYQETLVNWCDKIRLLILKILLLLKYPFFIVFVIQGVFCVIKKL